MIILRERNSQLRVEVAEEIKTLPLNGDRVKLQLILADLLRNIVNHAPFPNSWVGISISPGQELSRDNGRYIHLQFRMIHPGKGLPSEMLSDMFETRDGWVTPDGLGLKLSRKLLEQMNGRVSYVREDERCFFQVDLQVKTMLGVESRGTEGSSSIK
jgi:phytochrome E